MAYQGRCHGCRIRWEWWAGRRGHYDSSTGWVWDEPRLTPELRRELDVRLADSRCPRCGGRLGRTKCDADVFTVKCSPNEVRRRG